MRFDHVVAPKHGVVAIGLLLRDWTGFNRTVFHDHRAPEDVGHFLLTLRAWKRFCGSNRTFEAEAMEMLAAVVVHLGQMRERGGVTHKIRWSMPQKGCGCTAEMRGVHLIGRPTVITEQAVQEMAFVAMVRSLPPMAEGMAVAPEQKQAVARADAQPRASVPQVAPGDGDFGFRDRNAQGLSG